MDPSFRDQFGNVNRWFLTTVNQPQFKKVLGEVKLCETMAKFDGRSITVADQHHTVHVIEGNGCEVGQSSLLDSLDSIYKWLFYCQMTVASLHSCWYFNYGSCIVKATWRPCTVKLAAKWWALELVPYSSAGGLSTTGTARRYPWQPCEREPPLHAATTWHRHTDKKSVEKILTKPYTYLNPRIERVRGLGARICNDSQKLTSKWSAKISWKMKQKHATRCAASS